MPPRDLYSVQTRGFIAYDISRVVRPRRGQSEPTAAAPRIDLDNTLFLDAEDWTVQTWADLVVDFHALVLRTRYLAYLGQAAQYNFPLYILDEEDDFEFLEEGHEIKQFQLVRVFRNILGALYHIVCLVVRVVADPLVRRALTRLFFDSGFFARWSFRLLQLVYAYPVSVAWSAMIITAVVRNFSWILSVLDNDDTR